MSVRVALDRGLACDREVVRTRCHGTQQPRTSRISAKLLAEATIIAAWRTTGGLATRAANCLRATDRVGMRELFAA
jgi:hypothetical protein